MDSSFNDLATASLRYHLDFSVANNEDMRERYEDIIGRLHEKRPDFTKEEMAILHPPGWTFADDFATLPDGTITLKESTPEEKAVYAAQRRREEEWQARVTQARHDFIDIMPYLWS